MLKVIKNLIYLRGLFLIGTTMIFSENTKNRSQYNSAQKAIDFLKRNPSYLKMKTGKLIEVIFFSLPDIDTYEFERISDITGKYLIKTYIYLSVDDEYETLDVLNKLYNLFLTYTQPGDKLLDETESRNYVEHLMEAYALNNYKVLELLLSSRVRFPKELSHLNLTKRFFYEWVNDISHGNYKDFYITLSENEKQFINESLYKTITSKKREKEALPCCIVNDPQITSPYAVKALNFKNNYSESLQTLSTFLKNSDKLDKRFVNKAELLE